jgi:hypothetical protein
MKFTQFKALKMMKIDSVNRRTSEYSINQRQQKNSSDDSSALGRTKTSNNLTPLMIEERQFVDESQIGDSFRTPCKEHKINLEEGGKIFTSTVQAPND